MKRETGYKVTNQGNCSSIASGILKRAYKRRVWTEATPEALDRGFGLFYFEELEDARRFKAQASRCSPKIWECEIDEPIPLPKRAVWHKATSWISFDYGIKGGWHEDKLWPNGSRTCKRIRLIRRAKSQSKF